MARILFERQFNFFGNHYAVEQIISSYSNLKKKTRYFHSIEIFDSEFPNFSDACNEYEITKEQARAYIKQGKQATKTRFDLLKQMNVRDFTAAIAIDNVGDCRGVCPICQRSIDGNCDDCCVNGIVEYLEQKV